MKRYAIEDGQLIEHKAGALVHLVDVQLEFKCKPHVSGEWVSMDDVRQLLGEEGRQLIADGERFRFLLAITTAADDGDTVAAGLLEQATAIDLLDRRSLIDTMRHHAAALGWVASSL